MNRDLHHPRSHSRSRSPSRSSSPESENIDEILSAATGDEDPQQFPQGTPNHLNHPPHQQLCSNGLVMNGVDHQGHHSATHSPNTTPYQPHRWTCPYSLQNGGNHHPLPQTSPCCLGGIHHHPSRSLLQRSTALADQGDNHSITRAFTPTRSSPDISIPRLRARGDGRTSEEEQARL